MPFSEVRTEVGTISQTDFGYIGQWNLPMLSIMEYYAKFYDTAISRVIQHLQSGELAYLFLWGYQ